MKQCKNRFLLLTSYTYILMALLFSRLDISAQTYEYQSLIDSLSLDNISMHIDSLCIAGGYQSRVSFSEGNSFAGNYIYRYLKSIPGLEVYKDTFYIPEATPPYNEIPQFNVVAYLPGSATVENFVVFGAHYDASGSRDSDYDNSWQTVHAQGADDNATGCAAVMEIAKVLADTSLRYGRIASYRFVLYAAEEYHPVHPDVHHAGSLYDAKQLFDQNQSVRAAIILDMIGYNSNYYTEVISDSYSSAVADTIYSMRNNYVSDLQLNETPVNVPYSDHDSYWFYGFRAILLMENDSPWNNDSPYYIANPYYHKSSDTRDKLNYELVNKVTQIALASGARIGFVHNLSGVDAELVSSPVKFELAAYPNPFNPVTNIVFNSETQQYFTLEIFNSIGERVATLFRNRPVHGNLKIGWKANNLPSGIYFARLTAGSSFKNIKLVLMK